MVHKYKKYKNASCLPFWGESRRAESPPSCQGALVPCLVLGLLRQAFLCAPRLPGLPAEELHTPPSRQQAVSSTTKHHYPRQEGRRRNRPRGGPCKQRHRRTPKKEEGCGGEMITIFDVVVRLELVVRVMLSGPCPARSVLAGVPETL